MNLRVLAFLMLFLTCGLLMTKIVAAAYVATPYPRFFVGTFQGILTVDAYGYVEAKEYTSYQAIIEIHEEESYPLHINSINVSLFNGIHNVVENYDLISGLWTIQKNISETVSYPGMGGFAVYVDFSDGNNNYTEFVGSELPLIVEETNDVLKAKMDNLTSQLDSANSNYTTLTSDFELSRILNYLLIITTLVFIATTVYLVWKPKHSTNSETEHSKQYQT